MKRPGFLEEWNAARTTLAAGPVPRVVAILGDEPFIKERLIAAAAEGSRAEIESFAARPGESESQALDRLLDDWSTATLFGGRRLIVVRDCDRLLKGRGLARLEERLEQAAPPHDLLLTPTSLDGRTRLAKRLKASGGLFSLPVLRDAPPPWNSGAPFLGTDLNLWLVEEARLQGLRVTLEVGDTLTRHVGNEPGRLAQTLGRLDLLLSPGRRKAGAPLELSAADVERHVPASSARLLARYEDALRSGAPDQALGLADRMVRDGVYDPFMKLVSGSLVTETVLRSLSSSLARELVAHDALGSAAAALALAPWKRATTDAERLESVLGQGGRRVFLERDLRRTSADQARAAFQVAVDALRALRDGEPPSLHAVSLRLCRAFRKH